jgi:predicted HTH domain antitoxin
MKTLHIEFELPAMLVAQAGLDMDNISQDVRRIFALFLYEHKRVSLSKACEIGGMSLWEFADLNGQLGIPFHYSAEDLNEDLLKLAHV